ncbi:glycosyltransferase [Patescibacteria group bacterium]|nr:glycosyltransferase [Patescibacteria group bacterium]
MASDSLSRISCHVFNPNFKDFPEASIIIPSSGRDSLTKCLESIRTQSFSNFEVIIVTGDAPLTKVRNEGAKKARGKYIIFIDDDTVAEKEWLYEMVRTLRTGKAGVSGTTPTSKLFRTNRDVFSYERIINFFTDKRPGHLSQWGMYSLAATKEVCTYDGPVEYLEACNMAFNREIFQQLGGFDESYQGIGDWSEPDICFKIREAGHKLLFNSKARIWHEPSKTGAFSKRNAESRTRYHNYLTFSKRWIKPCWKHSIFKWILGRYYAIKTTK